jgi:hypothetical protein
MRIKLLGAQEALTGGVERVVLGDARGQRPILRALDGVGTVITDGGQKRKTESLFGPPSSVLGQRITNE